MTSKMKHPNNLFNLRKAAGLTQENIAQVWGVHRGDVSRIERGEHSITTAKRELLTKHFSWTASQILDKGHAAHIPVCGIVGESGAIILAEGVPLMSNDSLNESGSDEFAGCEHVDMPPGEYPLDLACVRVDGHVMHPVFKDGEHLFYRRNHHAEKDFVDCDCIVKLKDGRTMLRTIKHGRSFGHYDLDSYNQPPIQDVEIDWAAPIEWVRKKSG